MYGPRELIDGECRCLNGLMLRECPVLSQFYYQKVSNPLRNNKATFQNSIQAILRNKNFSSHVHMKRSPFGCWSAVQPRVESFEKFQK